MKKIIDAYVAAWNGEGIDNLGECIADNIVRTIPATMDGSTTSLTDLQEHIRGFRTAFPDMTITIDDTFGTDERYVLEWTFKGTNTGEGDQPPTNRYAEVSGISVYRVEDGKLAEETVQFDVLNFFQQLGHISEQQAAAA